MYLHHSRISKSIFFLSFIFHMLKMFFRIIDVTVKTTKSRQNPLHHRKTKLHFLQFPPRKRMYRLYSFNFMPISSPSRTMPSTFQPTSTAKPLLSRFSSVFKNRHGEQAPPHRTRLRLDPPPQDDAHVQGTAPAHASAA